uniref:alkaline phosphatase n=1 Tax=Cyprinus carpio carpio TaxID=630221 RepID=A0A9J7ZNE3_CYPCA
MATQQILLIIGIFVLAGFDGCFSVIPEEEQNPNFWYVKGKEALHTSLSMKPNLHRAKNLILFLGDGMGISTVTAARIMKGQMEGKTGEESVLAMDTFPHLALSKTYNVDKQMPDSAATATAYLCGVKSNYGTLGLSAAARRKDCSSAKGNEVKSILHQAKMAGKSVGIVSTARVQHASPAASYSHTPERGWYSDKDLSSEAVTGGCKDIAYQLVHNTDINVILGGGRQYMFPKETVDPEYSTFTGSRQDKTDLVDVWLRSRNKATYVWNKKDFDAVKEDNTDYLMGLFEPKDTRYELERDPSMDPSLTEMVEKAIKILRKNSKGFYLFVEGGRIDHGHSYRGNSVLGVSYSKAEDGKSFTNALYGNGPGYQIVNGTRPDMNETISTSDDYLQQAAVPLDSETHGSEDVAIFAKGPMAHLFHGVQEQSYIAHAMAYAACIEPYTNCQLENYAICTKFSLVVLMLSLLSSLTTLM